MKTTRPNPDGETFLPDASRTLDGRWVNMSAGHETTAGPLPIGQFARLVQHTVKNDPMFQHQALAGEVSSWNLHNGTVYFTLRDDDGQMDCVIWRNARLNVDPAIKVGSEVEVKNVIDGFENSWSTAKVTAKKGNKFTVEYVGFVDEKGKPDTESGVVRDRLRLRCGHEPRCLLDLGHRCGRRPLDPALHLGVRGGRNAADQLELAHRLLADGTAQLGVL